MTNETKATEPSAAVENLVVALADALLQRAEMLVTAESCTGGMLGAALTDLAGSSRWYERGFITYSNAAKILHLNVKAETLERFGAVSETTAREMAVGALACAPAAHWALTTTGIAGPGGATPGKPVGTVCFGFAWRAAGTIVSAAETQMFGGDRGEVRRAAVVFALHTLVARVRAAKG